MPLTISFKEIVQNRIKRDPGFADALLRDGIQSLLNGEVDVGKEIIRDYINGTIGFDELGKVTGTNPKSLMRMFSKTGNPQAKNLFPILAKLQVASGKRLEVRMTG